MERVDRLHNLVGSVAFEAKGEVPQLKEAAQIQLWQRNWWQTITYIISQKTLPFQEPLDSQGALQLAKNVARLLFLSARSGSPDDDGSWTKVETFCTDVGLVS